MTGIRLVVSSTERKILRQHPGLEDERTKISQQYLIWAQVVVVGIFVKERLRSRNFCGILTV